MAPLVGIQPVDEDSPEIRRSLAGRRCPLRRGGNLRLTELMDGAIASRSSIPGADPDILGLAADFARGEARLPVRRAGRKPHRRPPLRCRRGRPRRRRRAGRRCRRRRRSGAALAAGAGHRRSQSAPAPRADGGAVLSRRSPRPSPPSPAPTARPRSRDFTRQIWQQLRAATAASLGTHRRHWRRISTAAGGAHHARSGDPAPRAAGAGPRRHRPCRARSLEPRPRPVSARRPRSSPPPPSPI